MPNLRPSTPSDRRSDAGSRRGPILRVRESHNGGRHGVTCDGCLVGRCVSFRVAPGLYRNKSEPLLKSAKKNSGASPAARDAGKGGQFASPDEMNDKPVREYAQRTRKPSGKLAALDEWHRQRLADGLLTQLPNPAEAIDDED